MDSTQAGVVMGYAAFVISLVAIVLRYTNHKRCRSRCNKEEIVYSIDVDNTTPKGHQTAFCNPSVTEPLLEDSKECNN